VTTRDEVIAQLTGPDGPFALEDMDVDGVPWRVYAHAPATLRDVLAGTAAFGDAEFFVYDDDRITFARHLQLVSGLARHLRDEYGVEKGDRVAIGMRNYPEWGIAFWAAQALGAVVVPLNAWWTGGELQYGLVDSGSKVLVADGERLARMADVLPGLAGQAGLRTLVARHDGDLPRHVDRWEDVIAGFDGDSTLPDVELSPEDLATILYTSGTTGSPKGAAATHRNHITNLMNIMFMGALAAAMAPPPADGAAPPRPAPRLAVLQVFPFFHIGGLSGLLAYTAFGAKLVTIYKWDVDLALEILEREGITATAMVPTLLRELLEHPSLQKRDLTGLAGISSGGAPVPPDLIRRVQSEFAERVAPANGYGLTETTSAVIINSAQEYFEHPDSVGRPVVGADIRVAGPDGDDVATGEVGELWVRGPNVVQGYWNKPEATAETFTDGWFHTGDLGRVDESGLYYVVDRLKDVVIRGGENVYCAEVEAVLFEHPAVADVAIVGLPHRSLGEEVAAVVNLKPGAARDASDLQRFVAERLATFKVPAHVVFRDEPLPRTATGKVLKRDLRDEITRT
jgi:long-chain acyl-CoA synthetase